MHKTYVVLEVLSSSGWTVRFELNKRSDDDPVAAATGFCAAEMTPAAAAGFLPRRRNSLTIFGVRFNLVLDTLPAINASTSAYAYARCHNV